MERNVIYLAHNNDLYEVTYKYDGEVTDVVIYPDNNGQKGQSVLYWRLPLVVRDKIRDRINSALEP